MTTRYEQAVQAVNDYMIAAGEEGLRAEWAESKKRLEEVLYELRSYAADEVKDGLTDSSHRKRAQSAYDWLGDNIQAFLSR